MMRRFGAANRAGLTVLKRKEHSFGPFLDQKAYSQLVVDRRFQLFQFFAVVIGRGDLLVEVANLLIDQFQLGRLPETLRRIRLPDVEG